MPTNSAEIPGANGAGNSLFPPPPSLSLPTIARRINAISARHAGDIVEVGRLLTEAKQQLRRKSQSKGAHRRTFGDWCGANIDRSQSACSKALTAYDRLGKMDARALAKIMPSASRELCKLVIAGNATKQSATFRRVESVAIKSRVRLRVEDIYSALGLVAQVGSSAAPTDPTSHRITDVTVKRNVASEFSSTQYAECAKQLAELLLSGKTLHLSQDDIDESWPDDPRIIYATVMDGLTQKVESAKSVVQLLARLTGNEITRTCPKCGVAKSVDFYSKKTSWCKPCERQRLHEYKLRCRRGEVKKKAKVIDKGDSKPEAE